MLHYEEHVEHSEFSIRSSLRVRNTALRAWTGTNYLILLTDEY